MPISLEKGLIFVRIPNESESRIADLLELEDNQPHGVSYYLDNFQGAFTKTKKFCVVRNPWDRFALFYDLVKENEDYIDHDLVKDKSFEEFVTDFEANRDSYKNPVWLPQTAWIWSDYGPIINHIFVEDPEFLENAQFTDLATQIKTFLKLEVEIDDVDREAALERRENYYTNELVERVSKLFSHDVQAFSYIYEPIPEDAIKVSTQGDS
jgi:hypothetical protein